jgi:hypothetical protein
MEYCSPSVSSENKKICFSKKSLLSIINAWNSLYPNKKIIISENSSVNEIIKKIDDAFYSNIKKRNIHWAWTDLIKIVAKQKSKPNIINDMKKIEAEELRPSQPKEWVENPVEWLSNYDIEKVLKQYEEIPDFKYKFLGVFPIDFAAKKNNTCVFSNYCNIKIADIIKNGKIKYLGLITNLSRSNQPGTHWTSSFFVLDPNLKAYGGYYYDSTTGKIPSDLLPFFIDIKNQMEKIFNRSFNVYINNKRHQRSNTECGVFSISFQTRWLKLLNKNKDTTFEMVIRHPDFNDNYMKQLRYKFFRPNINYLKK